MNNTPIASSGLAPDAASSARIDRRAAADSNDGDRFRRLVRSFGDQHAGEMDSDDGKSLALPETTETDVQAPASAAVQSLEQEPTAILMPAAVALPIATQAMLSEHKATITLIGRDQIIAAASSTGPQSAAPAIAGEPLAEAAFASTPAQTDPPLHPSQTILPATGNPTTDQNSAMAAISGHSPDPNLAGLPIAPAASETVSGRPQGFRDRLSPPVSAGATPPGSSQSMGSPVADTAMRLGGVVAATRRLRPEWLPAQAAGATTARKIDAATEAAGASGEYSQARQLGAASYASSDARVEAPDKPAADKAAGPAEQISLRLVQAVHQGKSTLHVHLQPSELGAIDIRLNWHGDRLNAAFIVERPETLLTLKQEVQVLERALGQAGVNVGDLAYSMRQQRQSGDEPNAASRPAMAETQPALDSAIAPMPETGLFIRDGVVVLRV